MTAVVRVPAGVPERAAAPHAVNAAADQWVSVGPAVVVRGQATGLPRVAGRIVALAVHAEGVRVYAASALGGVWYSGDAGDHWIALDFYASALDADNVLQHADALTVGAIAVKWGATAADDVVYVGAGEHPTSGLEAPSSTLAAVGIRRAAGPVTAIAPVGAPVVGAAAADPWRVEAAELAGVAVNRLALDLVTDGVVWAATSRGLYRRTPGARPQWNRIDAGLGDGEISDVIVVAGLGAEPERIYATAVGGATARSVDDGAHWQTIALPPFPEAEVAAAIAIGRVQLAAGNVPGHAVVWALADGPRLWQIDGDVAERVSGLPRAIVEDDPDALKPYVLALAVHPDADAAHKDVIAVGGQTFAFPADRRHAALFTAQVTRVAGTLTFLPGPLVDGAPASWIGSGVPNGVQALAWIRPAAAGPTHLWVGGDGGIFRSNNDGARNSFRERNTSLGAIEVTTFAQAVDGDTVIVAGTRSNGLVRRRSAETWDIILHGGVGGVAIDPGHARRMYAQRARAAWRYTENARAEPFTDLGYQSKTPLGLAAPDQTRWDNARAAEDSASAPTSRIGLIAVGGSKYGTQRALGTNRIWYTDDQRLFEAKAAAAGGSLLSGWVTLPSLTDPYDSGRAGAPLDAQDRLDGAVLAAEWGADDRLYVLTEICVYFFERRVDGTWNDPVKLYDAADVQRRQKFKTPAGQIPWELPRTALAVHQFAHGKGSLYVGTSGAADKHHLWWHDGNLRWIDTGFDKDTPVHAIAVDPKNQQVVYIGTDRGVYRGTADFPLNADPAWQWAPYSDGLPGGACVDLAIYSPVDSPRRMLRAAIAGRGLWEVLLDAVTQGPELYLRAHAFDARRGGVPPGGVRDPLCAARVQVALDASPDVRVRRAPLPANDVPRPMAMQPLNTAGYDKYAIDNGSNAYDVWLMHAALWVRGEMIDPRAPWDAVASAAARLRQQNLLFPVPPAPTPQQLWERLLDGNPLPVERGADAADLAVHVRDEPDRWPKDVRASCASSDNVRVSITVHNRHWFPIAANSASIALIKTPFARRHSLVGTRALPAGWAARLRADLVGPLAAGPLSADWSYADAAAPFRAVPTPCDPLNPQVVTFDVSLAGASWNAPGWLLLAVVLVNGDAVPLVETDVEILVRSDGRVAARSVRKAAMLQQPLTVYAGTDVSRYRTQADTEQGWRDSNLMVTGLYLDSPFQDPAEAAPAAEPPPPPGGVPWVIADRHGHNRGANNPVPGAVDSWMRARGEIWPAWGLLPIYWGQQDPRNGDPDTAVAGRWLSKGPRDPREVMGLINAADAEAKAIAAGFPRGAVLYVDWEYGDPPHNPPIAGHPDHEALRDEYLSALWHRMAELGYRPGVYCRPVNSPRFRELCPWLFVWSVNNDRTAGAPANADVSPAPEVRLVVRTPELNVPRNPDLSAIARQWRLDWTQPAGNPVPNIFMLTGAGARVMDADVTLVADPSFPERRFLSTRAAGLIRIPGGRAAAAASDVAGECVIYTIRRARPARAAGALGALVRDRNDDLVAPDAAFLWNPFSTLAALRVAGPAGAQPTEMLFALGFAEAEGEEAMRLQVLEHLVPAAGAAATPFRHETIADGGFALDPLGGLAAVTRGDQSVEAFAVINPGGRLDNDGELAVARLDATTHAWSALTPIAAANARRTNRPCAVSRDAGIAEVFWIDPAGQLSTSASDAVNPHTWSIPAVIGDPAVEVHRFSNLAVVARNANRVDLLFLGRVPPPVVPGAAPVASVWRLYNVWRDGGGWNGAGHSRIADDGTVALEPLSSIAACDRDGAHLDVFTVGLTDGALYVTTLTYATDLWAGPVRIGAAPAGLTKIASVDSACSHGGAAADVQVIVTSRDGNLWATTWTAGAYGPLVALNATFPL